MKKILFAASAMSCAMLFAACSSDSGDDSPSGSGNEEEAVTHEDSTRVFVYSYEKQLLNADDISILADDTTKISIDLDFANKADTLLPKKGNVVVVWEAIDEAPYYMRVTSAAQDSGRLILDVSKASVFEALPQGEYTFSSKLYVNTSQMNENSEGEIELGDSAFYNAEDSSFHPIIISRISALESDDDNEEVPDHITLSKGDLDDALETDGYIDIREAIKSNGTYGLTANVVHIDQEIHPGTFSIPGMGAFSGDYAGSWMSALQYTLGDTKTAEDKMLKDYEKTSGKNASSALSNLAAFIRLDTIRFAYDEDIKIQYKTKWWGGPKHLEVLSYGSANYYISNVGFGLGAKNSGEKKLTNCPGYRLTFSVFGIPVWVVVYVDLYFKYSTQAYVLMNYPVQYRHTESDTSGFIWDDDDGSTKVDKEHHTTDYNKAKNFSDFVNKSTFTMDGKVSAGLYPRVSFLFYGAGGPSVGAGVRLDLEGKVVVDGDLLVSDSTDSDSDWHDAIGGYVRLDGAIPLELGGEIRIMGIKLFSRAYDIVDLYNWNFFALGDTATYKLD